MTLGLAPAREVEPFNNQFWTPLQLSVWPPLQAPNTSCTVYGLSLGLFKVGIHAKVPHEVLGEDAEDVVGFQIGGYESCSRELYGAQVSGFFSSNSKNLVGLQASLIENLADTMPCGIQFAGFANYLKNDLGFGLQLAGLWNQCRSETGVQAAFGWNECDSGVGLQLALLANSAVKDFTGVQFGAFNWGEKKHGRIEHTHESKEGHLLSHGRPTVAHLGVTDMRGIQLGLVGKAETLTGIQVGLIWSDATDAAGLQVGAINSVTTMTGLQLGFFNTADAMTGVQLGFYNHADTMTGIQIGLINVIKENTLLLIPLVNAHF
jgi:hypothetical protein